MMRLLVILIAVFAMGIALPGCSDSSDSEAQEMGFQAGQRPAKETKRPPPGPQGSDAGFERRHFARTAPRAFRVQQQVPAIANQLRGGAD